MIRMPGEDRTNWYKQATIYALDISRFFDSDGDGSGDIRGLIAKLDYLENLGVDCLWLLPFHPSGGQDNGYDVTNYLGINPRIGTLEDFRAFMKAAKLRNMRVVMDLVVHHTSVQHPWFIAATSDRTSKYHDYYIWSEQLSPEIQEDNAFPTVVDGIWTYDETVNQYYRHKFYSSQPDLNIANKDVQQEIYDIIDFWLAFGIDGFRIDAAGLILRDQNSKDPDLKPEVYFEQLRKHIDNVKPSSILIAEADVSLPQIPEFFGDGKRYHMLYNFLLNNEMFHAIATESADVLAGAIAKQDSIRLNGTWINFVRNSDELNLDHLTDEQRKQVTDVLAPDPKSQIYGRGIRRRLPPMLNNDPRHIRMVYSLMFALPGVPMLLYGEEIGMGDDMTLNGRSSVRVPMQWNTYVNGGFSSAEHDDLIAPANTSPDYGYKEINIDKQQQDQHSLLHFMQQLIAVHKQCPWIATDVCTVLDTGNSAVIGLAYGEGKPSRVILHNLSRHSQSYSLKGIQESKLKPIFGRHLREHTLGPHGYVWLTGK